MNLLRIGLWDIFHAAVSRRPPISFSRMVARIEGYTYAAKGGRFFSFKDHFLSPLCQTRVTIRK
jgi:hypothetical protein